MAIKVSKTRAEWLADRELTIGASEAAAVVGATPWQTKLQLYMVKRGLMSEVERTELLNMGHAMEPIINDLFCEKTGRQTDNPGEFCVAKNPEYPGMSATLDRIILPGEGTGFGNLQLKNVGPRMARHWDDEYPLYVKVQMQAEMMCAGFRWSSVAAVIAGQRFFTRDLERDDTFCAHLAEQCREFMVCVREGIQPEPNEKDADALRILYPKHEPGSVKALHPDCACIDADLLRAMEDLKDARARVRLHSNRIKGSIGDAEKGVLPDGTSYTFRTVNRRGFKVRPTTYRRLRRRNSDQ